MCKYADYMQMSNWRQGQEHQRRQQLQKTNQKTGYYNLRIIIQGFWTMLPLDGAGEGEEEQQQQQQAIMQIAPRLFIPSTLETQFTWIG